MMSRTLIIAEAGVNHNGDINLAKKLIDVAAQAGVDYVKFQTFKAEKLVTEKAKQADYQEKNIGNAGETQFAMLKKLELDLDTHNLLIAYCKEKGVKFLSTAFDLDSVDLLNELGIDVFKIPSGEMTNLPYLEKIAGLGKPVILSTGMCTIGDVERAYNVFIEGGIAQKDLSILHCNTEYPTPMVDVNLKAMNTLGQAFDVKYGYSDHTLGIEVPIAAVARGATVIEKHFTLDKQMEGPDHKASLEPKELIAMVSAIRNIEAALGSSIKKPSNSEKKNIVLGRKSIVANFHIKKGELLTPENLTLKRAGIGGITPMEWYHIIGQVANKNYKPDEIIKAYI
jgi:N,N'-diacetyllegionaminate synthase